MATDSNTKNLKIKETDQNQEEEENDWDDWGDAEDNFSDVQDVNKDTKASEKSPDRKESVLKSDKDDNSKKKNKSESPKEDAESYFNWSPLTNVMASVMETATVVSQGFNQIMKVPDPEELARINASEEKQEQIEQSADGNEPENTKESPTASSPGYGLISGVTNIGSKVINTGLDTLEGIGKKTMDLLLETDPYVVQRFKNITLESDRPCLSRILQQARDESNETEKKLRELEMEKFKQELRLEIIFENNCGLVHYEALEILSKECELKIKNLLDSVSGNALNDLRETLNEVKELFELEEIEGESDGLYNSKELKEKLQAAIQDAEVTINFDDIVHKWSQADYWLTKYAYTCDDDDVFAKCITIISQTCAMKINKLHKIAEQLLIKEHHSTANEVDSIVQLCKQFYMHMVGMTNRCAGIYTDRTTELSKTHSNTLFTEMALGTKHIEKAFKLFLPILQIGAV